MIHMDNEFSKDSEIARSDGTDEAPQSPPKAGNKGIDEIHVYGDSHSKFFFRTSFYAPRLRLVTPVRYRIEGKSIPASSVAGFRPGDRKLNVKDTIREKLPSIDRLILAFGQVDLELGYYYRLVVKKEHVTPESYVAWLLDIYRDFLITLTDFDCDIALKGVNLTALTPEPFAAKYVSRIIEGERRRESEEALKALAPHLLSEDEQNAMHLAFNLGLSRLADDLGMRYFDLVAETLQKSIRTPRLADLFKTADFDHHLVDSVVVRRLHYVAAGKVFDLRNDAAKPTGPATESFVAGQPGPLAQTDDATDQSPGTKAAHSASKEDGRLGSVVGGLRSVFKRGAN